MDCISSVQALAGSLWKRINFCAPYADSEVLAPREQREFEALAIQADRAQDCALDMSINLAFLGRSLDDFPPTTDFSVSCRALLYTLMRKVHSSRRLDLCGPLPPNWTLPDGSDRVFSSLETLSIGDPSWMDRISFQNAPVLGELHISYLTLTPSLPLSWNTIQHLDLYSIQSTLHNFLQVLQLAAPQLQVIVLRHLEPPSRGSTQPATESLPVVELPRLRELAINGLPMETWGRDMVAQLRPKRLEWTLRLKCYWGLRLVHQFPSFPHITSNLAVLIIEGPWLPNQAMTSVLLSLNALETLDVTGDLRLDNVDFLLNALEWPRRPHLARSDDHDRSVDLSMAPNQATCPSLTKLKLKHWVLSVQMLEAMIQSRTQSLSLDTRHTAELGAPCRLRELYLDDVWMRRNKEWSLDGIMDMLKHRGLKGSGVCTTRENGKIMLEPVLF